MKVFTGKHSALLIVYLLFAPPLMAAADIAHDVRTTDADFYSRDGGFIEIGLKANAWHNPIKGEGSQTGLSLLLDGSYQWNGLFIEVIEGSSALFTIGYNAWNSTHWSWDIVVSQLYDDISDEYYEGLKGLRKNDDPFLTLEDSFINEGDGEEIDGIIGSTDIESTFINDDANIIDRFKGLRDRKGGFLVGSRTTAYYGSYILQFGLLTDISNRHNSIIMLMEAGKSWQLRNWNLYALSRASYHTAQVVNYYLGVLPEEANSTFPEYKAGAGSILSFKVGTTYPLGENWLFRSTLEYDTLSKSFYQSPLLTSRYGASFSTSISYVF